VHQDQSVCACQDCRPEDFAGMGNRLIQAAHADDAITDHAHLGVQQHGNEVFLVRFVGWIVGRAILRSRRMRIGGLSINKVARLPSEFSCLCPFAAQNKARARDGFLG
jgi:hypothetical protein